MKFSWRLGGQAVTVQHQTLGGPAVNVQH